MTGNESRLFLVAKQWWRRRQSKKRGFCALWGWRCNSLRVVRDYVSMWDERVDGPAKEIVELVFEEGLHSYACMSTYNMGLNICGIRYG